MAEKKTITTYESEAQYRHDLAVDRLYNYWRNIAINLFEWQGLPEDKQDLINSETTERFLFEDGRALYFDSGDFGEIILKCNLQGKNVIGKPTSYQAYGYGYMKTLDADKGVLIKANPSMIPLAEQVRAICEQMVDIDETRMLRLSAHKTPFMIKTTKDYELTAKNIYDDLHASKPVIYELKGNLKLATEMPEIEILNTGAEYINDKLLDEYNTLQARLMTLLGIDNFLEDKMERVQSAEVNSQKEFIQLNFDNMLECRQKACERINAMFGTNLSIKTKKDEYLKELQEMQPLQPFNDFGGGDNE